MNVLGDFLQKQNEIGILVQMTSFGGVFEEGEGRERERTLERNVGWAGKLVQLMPWRSSREQRAPQLLPL